MQWKLVGKREVFIILTTFKLLFNIIIIGFGGSFSRTLEVWGFAVYFLIQYVKTNKLKKGDPVIYSKGIISIILSSFFFIKLNIILIICIYFSSGKTCNNT